VRTAALVAVVRPVRAVLHVASSGAVVAASAQLGVERVEHVRVELADLSRPTNGGM